MTAPEVSALVAWGRSLGVTGPAGPARPRPWSTTVRVGDVWLKACAPGVAAEAPLLAAMAWWHATSVVLPLAVDAGRGYLALPHAGAPLREVGADVATWERVLVDHAALHRRLQPRADDAVALGVPDLRPARLGAELERLLAQVSADLREAVDRRALEEDCALLAAGPVGACVQHDDLHDGNVVVDDRGRARVLDWGDAAVSHPFGVLLVTLRSVADLGEVAVARLRDAYLETWTDLAPAAELRALAEAAVRVQPLLRALAWERALAGTDEAERAPWGDPVEGWLQVLAGQEG